MGEFIPKPYKTEQISIRIDSEVIEEVDKFALYFNMSRSKFLNQCIKFALERLDTTTEKKDK